MRMPSADLTKWTEELIRAECSRSYRSYEKQLQNHYAEYFDRNPKLRSSQHPYCARTISGALPPNYSNLLWQIPNGALHRFARSARSSQMIGLALLGGAAENDPSFRWLWPALRLPTTFLAEQATSIRFEQGLAPTDLNEFPRTTQLDIAISNERVFLAIETKWSEPGFPSCSCEREGTGNRLPGFDCAQRVYDRAEYWMTCNRFLGLPETRLSFNRCYLSPVYQIVRNIAAARKLSRGRRPGFILIYDQTNPFFHHTGNWPGWPHILTEILRKQSKNDFHFRATSWQTLIHRLPLDPIIRRWAKDKHRL